MKKRRDSARRLKAYKIYTFYPDKLLLGNYLYAADLRVAAFICALLATYKFKDDIAVFIALYVLNFGNNAPIYSAGLARHVVVLQDVLAVCLYIKLALSCSFVAAGLAEVQANCVLLARLAA